MAFENLLALLTMRSILFKLLNAECTVNIPTALCLLRISSHKLTRFTEQNFWNSIYKMAIIAFQVCYTKSHHTDCTCMRWARGLYMVLSTTCYSQWHCMIIHCSDLTRHACARHALYKGCEFFIWKCNTNYNLSGVPICHNTHYIAPNP